MVFSTFEAERVERQSFQDRTLNGQVDAEKVFKIFKPWDKSIRNTLSASEETGREGFGLCIH